MSLYLVKTDKARHITRAYGIGSEPHFNPDYYRLYEISQPKPTRTLLHVQREYPHNKEWIEEWVFVCVKKHGQWRLDSAQSRLVGGLKYNREYLG